MEELFEIIAQFHFRNELWVLFIPLALMAIDALTGIIKAWAHNDFQSGIMRIGLAKKAEEIVILIAGELLSYGLMLPDAIMNLYDNDATYFNNNNVYPRVIWLVGFFE